MIIININPLIEEAFANFTISGTFIPIAFLNYTGSSNIYLTYYTWLDKPDNFHDDEHHAEITYATIDIFSKGNFKRVLKEVKNKLKENGFIWTDNGAEDFEKDTGYYHIPINFYYMSKTENN